MKICFDRMKQAMRYLCAMAILAVVTGGCTTVDDSLGLNFVPDGSRPAFAVDTVYNIDAYLTQTDKIPSNNLGVTFLGNTLSDIYGRTTASALIQYVPGSFTDDENRFGPNPTADSILFNLYVNSYTGDSTVALNYHIYEVNKPIVMDSTYYVDFPAEEVIEPTPLFSFSHKAGEHFIITLKASDSEPGKEFMQRLADAPASVYDADTAFLNKFNGFYIAPVASDLSVNAALSDISLEDSYMTLYTHFHDTETDKDSVVSLSYYFDDGTYSYNTSISCVEHDYTGRAQIEPFLNDTLPSDSPVSTAYVQTLAGVTTYLRFGDQFRSDVEALRAKHGEGFENASMVINQARLVVEMEEPQPPLTWTEAMNKAPNRFGMFFNYTELENIPDYYYQYEQQEGGTLVYDGYLNRSNYYYQMDITTYIQRMVSGWEPGHTAQQQTVYLTPDVSLTYTFGQVALRSPAEGDGQMKLILTYTLMK